MDVLQEILKWSGSELPLWARDSLRRQIASPSLEDSDYDELLELIKIENKISVSDKLEPLPLNKDHIPVATVNDQIIKIKELSNLVHVNRIAPDQKIAFCDNGITIIYGMNGAGKSGYGRVLKHACRARDKGGAILPNVNLPGYSSNIPNGKFKISLNEQEHDLEWSYNSPSPELLSSISVFDTLCASSYLKEGEASYLPRGLDILEEFANTIIPKLAAKVLAEAKSIDINKDLTQVFTDGTSVSDICKILDHKTDILKLRELATLKDVDLSRDKELDKVLAEKNPEEKYKELLRSVSHIKDLCDRINNQSKFINNAAMARLKTLIEGVTNAEKALNESAKKLAAGDDLLPNTGESIWRDLFLSAKKYSLSCAYPDHEFPSVGNDAKCVLCQQPISEATDRMLRFNDFINDDISKLLDERKSALKTARDKIYTATLDFSFNAAIHIEIGNDYSELIEKINKYQEDILIAKTGMLSMIDSKEFVSIEFYNNPISDLRHLAAIKLCEARLYKQASRNRKTDVLIKESKELKARIMLTGKLEGLISLIGRLKLYNTLNSISFSAISKKVSDKSKLFANSIISNSLKKELDEEFLKLGVSHIKTVLKPRVSKGKVFYSLLLDIPFSNKVELILSEGEQRAVSLASFLAELKLANHSCGIIFDDPVSSLDHHRRRRVATRLVEEAKKRQVIILTHDIAFLSELIFATEKNNVDSLIHHLQWTGEFSGCVYDGLPWDKVSYKARVEKLKQESRQLDPWPVYPNEEQDNSMRRLYSRMRSTVEKMVEDVIFAGIVVRFSEIIGVGNLHKLSGLERECCIAISELWSKCHRITDAHDQPTYKQTALPNPDEFRADLELILDLAKRAAATQIKK
ncbi:TPA: AAA family ATPase [Yersinia enterocolitica]|nr:AAA family ATPase [Yersinia enterocolitica]HEN3367465.1 AAA family ATPase [Yersinia enterocolitica]HEN3400492.1 AAA family ATPase [Yersinia enterocolitica]HEN3422607.1 AAA family ATPase [Yersinia enterocolitica]